MNAYFNRPFCVSEVRWRVVAGKHLQPVVHADDKTRIGEFVGMAPDDLKKIGGIDFVDLNLTDKDYWKLGLSKIVDKAVDVHPSIWHGDALRINELVATATTLEIMSLATVRLTSPLAPARGL